MAQLVCECKRQQTVSSDFAIEFSIFSFFSAEIESGEEVMAQAGIAIQEACAGSDVTLAAALADVKLRWWPSLCPLMAPGTREASPASMVLECVLK